MGWRLSLGCSGHGLLWLPHSPPDRLLLKPTHACSSGDDEDDDEDLSNNKIVQFCKSLTSFTDSYDGDKFFTVQAS